MTIEVITLPAYWASALVNGDFSGLEADEERRVRRWIEAYQRYGYAVVDVARDEDGEAREPRFTWNYDLYDPDAGVRGGEVLDYIMHRTSCRTCSLSPLYMN